MDKYDLLKSHIDQYTRKDGTVVQAHDDKRQAAQPHPVGQTLSGPAAQAIHGGRESARKKFGATVTRSHMAEGGKGLVETHDGYGNYAHHTTEDSGKSWGGGYISAKSSNKDERFDAAVGKLGGAAKPDGKAVAGALANKYAKHFNRKSPEWQHDGQAIPASEAKGVPEYTHKEVYGHDNETSPAADDFSPEFSEKHRPAENPHFVIKHKDGAKHFVDSGGYNYARHHIPVSNDAGAEKPAAEPEAAKPANKPASAAGSGVAPISRHAQALRDSSKPGDLDHRDNLIAAGHMAAADHKSLKQHLSKLDTAASDHILDYVHPDHWKGLGFEPLNIEKSKAAYGKKFDPKKAKAGGPSAGEVGHEERQQYGKYFKKGDKVKDGSGNQHTVVSHHGPEVKTESGQSFHPTKLDHAADSGFMQKPEWHHSPEHHAAVKNGFGGDKDVDVSPSKSSLGDSDVGIKHGENFISHSISPRTKSDGSKHFAVNGHAKVGGKQGPVTSAKSFPTVGDAVDHIKGVHKQFREMSK
jgi:hypothetical protein